MKALVFGTTGQVARALRPLLPEAIFVSRDRCDFVKPAMIDAVLDEEKPTLIINTVAYTNVDAAEQNPDLAGRVNGDAPARIARWCVGKAVSLIHYSTDFVYAGTGNGFWKEDEVDAPPNVYGVTKLRGDQGVLLNKCHAIVLRPSWIFDHGANNFIGRIITAAHKRPVLEVVDDQIGSPTWAHDLAVGTLAITNHPRFKESRGVFNVANRGVVSKYDFAARALELHQQRHPEFAMPELVRVPTVGKEGVAARPLNTRLDQNRLKAVFGIEMPPWQKALEQVMAKRED